jgi:anti-sigma B factor antagonist
MTEFSIRAVANGPQCDLILSGDVDLEVVEALTRVAHSHLAHTGVQCLRFDLGAVTFIGSTGMGALVAIRNAAQYQGKMIELDNIPLRIRRLLVITGLDGVFGIDSGHASGAKLSGPQSVADGSERDAPTDPQLHTVPS